MSFGLGYLGRGFGRLGRGGADGASLVRRLVGTLNGLPLKGKTSDGVMDSVNFKRYCYTPVDIINPKAAFVGFNIDASGTQEHNFDNAVSYHSSILLPDSTVHEFPVAGSGGTNILTVSPGDVLKTTDTPTTLPNNKIPAGGFWICGQLTVASGGFFYRTDNFKSATFLTYIEQGVGLADKTLVPLTIGTATADYIPCGIGVIGNVPSSHRLVFIEGDSQSTGVGGYVLGLTGGVIGVGYGNDRGVMAAYCAGKGSYLQVGYPGDTARFGKSLRANRAALAALCGATDLYSDMCGNDLVAGRDPTTQIKPDVEALIAVYTAAVPTARIWQATGTPGTDASNVVLANEADGKVLTWNTIVLSNGLTGMTGAVDHSSMVQNTGDRKIWVDLTYTADGLHYTPLAGAIVKTSLDTNDPLYFVSRSPINLSAAISAAASVSATISLVAATARQALISGDDGPIYINTGDIRQSLVSSSATVNET